MAITPLDDRHRPRRHMDKSAIALRRSEPGAPMVNKVLMHRIAGRAAAIGMIVPKSGARSRTRWVRQSIRFVKPTKRIGVDWPS
jgi:hypothetical protein